MTAQGSFTNAHDSQNQTTRRLDILPYGNIKNYFKKFEFSCTPVGTLSISADEIDSNGWAHGRLMEPIKFLQQTQDSADFISFLQHIDPRKHFPIELSQQEITTIQAQLKRLLPGASVPATPNKPHP